MWLVLATSQRQTWIHAVNYPQGLTVVSLNEIDPYDMLQIRIRGIPSLLETIISDCWRFLMFLASFSVIPQPAFKIRHQREHLETEYKMYFLCCLIIMFHYFCVSVTAVSVRKHWVIVTSLLCASLLRPSFNLQVVGALMLEITPFLSSGGASKSVMGLNICAILAQVQSKDKYESFLVVWKHWSKTPGDNLYCAKAPET